MFMLVVMIWYYVVCYAVVSHNMVWCALLCSAMLWYVTVWYGVLCYGLICYAVYAVLCCILYAVLCYAMLYSQFSPQWRAVWQGHTVSCVHGGHMENLAMLLFSYANGYYGYAMFMAM